MLRGSPWVEGTALHFIDSGVVERSVVGVSQGASPGLVGSIWIDGTTMWYIDETGTARTLPKTQVSLAASAVIGSIWVDSSGVGAQQLRYIGTDNYIYQIEAVTTSPSASVSASPSTSVSASPSPSKSASASPSTSASISASPSASPSVSKSSSASPSISSSVSTSVSSSISPSPSKSASASVSKSSSASPSASASASPSAPPAGFAITLDPTTSVTGVGTLQLMIYSAGLFTVDSQAYFDNTPIYTEFYSTSVLYTEIPPGYAAGTYDVYVVSSGSESETDSFEFTPASSVSSSESSSISASVSASPSPPPPGFTITLDPTAQTIAVGFVLTVYSAGDFMNGESQIIFDGTPQITTWIDSSTVECYIADTTTTASGVGTVDVSVVVQGVYSDPASFEIQPIP